MNTPDRLRELVAINRAIIGSLNYEEVLGLIVEKTATFFGAEACLLLLTDEAGQAQVAASVGVDGERTASFRTLLDERISAALRELLGFRSEDTFLGAPVIQHEQMRGILAVYSRATRLPGADDEFLLSALADQAAIALDHAARYRTVRDDVVRGEQWLRVALDAGEIGVWDWDIVSNRINWSDRLYQFHGLEPDTFGGTVEHLLELVHPEDRDRVSEALRRTLEEKAPYHLEFRTVRPDGQVCWLSTSARVIWDAANQPIRLLGATQDISERKQAEEALRHALETVAQANEQLEQRVEERTRALRERTEELIRMSELRQELLRQLVTAQEQERGRIARDLHDDTGQQLAALLLGLNRLSSSPGVAADPAARDTITHVRALAREVAQKSHRHSLMLRPTSLDDFGLVVALTNATEEWAHWSGIPVEVEAIGLETRLPLELEITIYRVVQEALTNVLRHAVGKGSEPGAGRVSILLQRRRQDEALVVIEDDGPGFDVEAALNLPPGQRRFGIFGMQERARLAGGTLTVESGRGQGTTVNLRLPISNDSSLNI